MLLRSPPTAHQLDALFTRLRSAALTYADAGITRDARAPTGFAVDHNRILLGHGPEIFARAADAMRHWRQFDIPWLSLERRGTAIQTGEIVAVVPRVFGFVTVSPCRIVYVIDEHTPDAARFGFGYGTLPGHVGRGEERFLVEHTYADDRVHYEIFAASQPGLLLTRLGYPMMRLMQRRFARDSKTAMQRACQAARH
jgi:uncharacterized protein (UPF0548 family)